MLKEARLFLNNEYQKNIKRVPQKSIYKTFCDEKIHHSAQVLGAALYILKNEADLARRPQTFQEIAKTAALLHDIARFDEAFYRYKYADKKYNHGREGSLLLGNIEKFNLPQITLSIKYHGDIYITPLYNDEDFCSLDKTIQEQTEKIAKLVRDADKIANFHLFFNRREHLENLILSGFATNNLKDKKPDEKNMQEFLHEHLLKTTETSCRSERILQIIAWIFDLNYASSVRFCLKLGLFEKMLSIFNQNCGCVVTQEIVANKLKSYIKNNYQI